MTPPTDSVKGTYASVSFVVKYLTIESIVESFAFSTVVLTETQGNTSVKKFFSTKTLLE